MTNHTKNGFLCASEVYRYKGFLFEWHGFCGPVRLKKNGEPSLLQSEKFLLATAEWLLLPKSEREKYNVNNLKK